MNSKKEKELFDYLKSLGFEGEKLESDIRKRINRGLLSFTVGHEIRFGEERMHFQLRLRKDLQFEAYRLEEYMAIYRKPANIEHRIIDGIDTRQLEERMKGKDWISFFENPDKITDSALRSYMSKTVEMLNTLSAGIDPQGRKIREELIFNHWPTQVYTPFQRPDLYELSQEFTATENGICNANLAYVAISGKLGDLYDLLAMTDLQAIKGIDLYSKLEDILSENPDRFEITCSRNEPEGFIEYRIPVHRVEDGYFADTNLVTFTPHPSIEHGVFNGIDSAELEQKMQKINWHNDRELFIFHEDREPEFLPEVDNIQEQMHRLSQDMAGADVADQLQLKYWISVTFFDGMIPSTAWQELENRPKIQQHFPLDFDAKSIFNLMCGRCILDKTADRIEPEQGVWLKLNLKEKDESGMHPLQRIAGFPSSSLEDLLHLLPINPDDFDLAERELMRGGVFQLPVKNNQKILLMANPQEGTLNLYTPEMKPIPFNYHFDPEWRPSTEQNVTLTQNQEKIPGRKFWPKPHNPTKRKGRGL